MAGPLEGIRVVDLTRILAGPYCTMMLGDMGAEIIKIENPDGGDDTRGWGPPFLNGVSTYFISINRNKKSLTLNLKDERGKELLRDLIRNSDVMVENFRPGALEKLGFPWEEIHRINPAMIFASLSGFGQTGPRKSEPGFDVVIQGEGGIMSITGEPDAPPSKVGASIADITAGMLAAQGILLSLYHREKTGVGQMVDVGMLDGQVALLTYHANNYFGTGKLRPGGGTSILPSRRMRPMSAGTDTSTWAWATTACGAGSATRWGWGTSRKTPNSPSTRTGWTTAWSSRRFSTPSSRRRRWEKRSMPCGARAFRAARSTISNRC